MSQYASIGARPLHAAIEALRAQRITVEFTADPVTPDATSRQADDGCVLAAVGLLTITRTGRAVVELYDAGDHIRASMLDHLSNDVATARHAGRAVTELRCWLRPETVAELQAWAEVRTALTT